MSKTYNKPSMIVYGRDEIMDLIGPVKTQYGPPPCDCSDPQHPPQWKEFQAPRPFTFSIATGGCPDFERVEVRILDNGALYDFYQLSRSDGVMQGDRWAAVINNFNLDGPPGRVYQMSVTLVDPARPAGQVCVSTITVDPDPLQDN